MSPTGNTSSGKKRAAKKAASKPAAKTRAPSPLREAQKELARQKLIEAAREAFEEKGYVDVTIEDIVQRAGASRATFYIYFQSKCEILRAITDVLAVEVRAGGLFDDFATMGKPSVDALEQWFEKYVEFYFRHRPLWRAMHQAQVVEPEFIAIVEASIDQYVQIWQSSGFIKGAAEKDLRLVATMLYTLSDQFMYLWLLQSESIDRKKATRTLAEVFHSAVTSVA